MVDTVKTSHILSHENVYAVLRTTRPVNGRVPSLASGGSVTIGPTHLNLACLTASTSRHLMSNMEAAAIGYWVPCVLFTRGTLYIARSLLLSRVRPSEAGIVSKRLNLF